jgi:hypothetical protein
MGLLVSFTQAWNAQKAGLPTAKLSEALLEGELQSLKFRIISAPASVLVRFCVRLRPDALRHMIRKFPER